jgi:ammonium transporter, Amt family
MKTGNLLNRPATARALQTAIMTALAGLLPAVAWAQSGDVEYATKSSVDELWLIVSAGLVFFMQTGFLAFEVGCVRPKNTTITALKNVGDWMVISIVFYLFGFGIMFGDSVGGWFGSSMFLGPGPNDVGSISGWVFFLFQLSFCGTAATIVSGAMAERTGFKAYLTFCIIVGAIIYPIYGHWVWGNGFFGANKPFLADMGFVDFAGSSVVHMIGGFCSLAGIIAVGPRIGRFNADGTCNPLESNSLAWSALGTLLLWFCWWGFNGGSGLAFNEDVPTIILNTNLAGAAGGVVAFFHAQKFQDKRDVEEKLLGGALGGLVAITACCHVLTPPVALIVGVMAGVVHNLAFDLLKYRWYLDDVVGAVPVHGFCGALGILCVALAKAGAIEKVWYEQLWVQAIGIGVCFAWAFGVSWLSFKVLKVTTGIRVAPFKEIRGLGLSHAEAEDDDDDDDHVPASPSEMAAAEGAYQTGQRYDSF